MSYSDGCQSLVVFLCFFIFFLGFPAITKANPFVESSSREDLARVAGYGEEKLSTVLVIGSVHCETCLLMHGDEEHQIHAWPVAGASVAVKCLTGAKRKSVVARGVTDEYGDFIIDIPSHLHGFPHIEKICTVRVLRMPKNSGCQPAYHVRRRHTGISLSSYGNGIRTYTAGKIALLPSTTHKPLQACMSNRVDQIQKGMW